ncbi:MAG TPA: Holliday junction branch migration DNA helicase RuvB [Lacunisphaera sp.]|nr:Holliday junction branch migration DNA helicase RuvB [Lacunisphaera sp.]
MSKSATRNPQSATGASAPKGTDFLATALTAPVSPTEAALRPLSFSDFSGQPKTVERLQVMVGAARRRGEALNHILLSGPPGLGKTTLAFILGHELGRNVRVTSGPVIEKAGDLAGLLTNLEQGDILFIDEIHRIPKTVEEYLYSAMEDFRLDIMIDQGPNARSVRLSIPKFTLIGATTRSGLLTAPLRSRFTLNTRLDYYDRATLEGIVRRSCGLLKVEIDPAGAKEIAARARGTPRIANNLVNFVRDYASEKAQGRITQPVAAAALELLEIDAAGLDEMDKRVLRLMAENYKGGPVGLGTIAIAVGEEAETLEEVHEPFLIQEGYLARTAQGRVLTAKGYGAIGLRAATGDAQQTLL